MTKKTDRAPTRRACPVTRSELARRANRTPAAVTIAARLGGALHDACLPGGRLDAASDAAVRWALKGGIDPAALLDQLPAPQTPPRPETSRRGRGRPTAAAKAATVASDAAAPDHNEPAEINVLLDLTLREIVSKHQSVQGFADWLDRRKKIADIARAEFNTARSRDLYVPRQWMEHHIFGFLEATNLRLLREMPVTAVSTLFNLAKSGGTLEDGQRELRKFISSNLKYATDRAAKLMRTGGREEQKRKTPR